MKLKNILLIASIVGISFSSCTEEEVITPVETDDTSLNLTLNVRSTLSTKAVGESTDPYDLATPDELVVKHVDIAIFRMVEGVPTSLIGNVLHKNNPGETTYKDTLAYEVLNIPAMSGDVRILVIANSTKDYSSLKTYAEFLSQVETTNFATINFDPTNLVKVGVMDCTLAKSNDNKVVIPMTQLAARVIVKLDVEVLDGSPVSWAFTATQPTVVEQVMTQSKVILKDNTNISEVASGDGQNLASFTIPVEGSGVNTPTYFKFYTYEKPQSVNTSNLSVVIEGQLQQFISGAPTDDIRDAKYRLYINPTVTEQCKTAGVLNGNAYDVKGKILINRLEDVVLEFTQTEWVDVERLTEVKIEEAYYLHVRDLVMAMPNKTNITTTFQSSSYIRIPADEVKVYAMKEGGRELETGSGITVTPDLNSLTGNIVINGPVPTNYMPREIEFTVYNTDGLSQIVKVKQYPPFYVEAWLSDDRKAGTDSQTNWNMYKFTTVVPDYSAFPDPDELDEEYTIRGNEHKHEDGTSQTRGDGYAAYIRSTAITGYPLVDTNGYTINTPNNNRLIAPSFILASQFGTVTNNSSYDQAQKDGRGSSYPSCKDYVEHHNGVAYTDWRLPTKAEIYMIDVLQNVKNCDIKALLEGRYYWSAETSRIQFMDARLSGSTSGAAYRCVHDIR